MVQKLEIPIVSDTIESIKEANLTTPVFVSLLIFVSLLAYKRYKDSINTAQPAFSMQSFNNMLTKLWQNWKDWVYLQLNPPQPPSPPPYSHPIPQPPQLVPAPQPGDYLYPPVPYVPPIGLEPVPPIDPTRPVPPGLEPPPVQPPSIDDAGYYALFSKRDI